MDYATYYARQIRLADGSLLIERRLTESSRRRDISRFYTRYILETIDGTVQHEKSWTTTDGDDHDKTGEMPTWWSEPSASAQLKLGPAFEKAPDTILPVTNNVVTFAVYRDNGDMMGQLRSFVSPTGKPIGNPGMPSMHGGLIEASDFDWAEENTLDKSQIYNAACLFAVAREYSEEFGIRILYGVDFQLAGHVYDADNGRFNHVFRVLTSYESALVQDFLYDMGAIGLDYVQKQQISNAVRQTISAILDCEGLGRFTKMSRPDLERAMELNALTPISIKILNELPTLKPPTDRHAV